MKIYIALIISAVLLTGCASQKNNNNSSSDNESVAEESNLISTAEVEIEDSDIEAYPTDWRSAYREELYNYMDSDNYSDDSRFSLYDINGDDIPELFISWSDCHAAGCKVYTFTDRLISFKELGSWGACIFYPDKKILHGGYTGQGFNHGHYYQLDNNGNLSELASFYDNSGSWQETKEYKVNDVEVTEEEYKKAQEDYSDNNQITLGRDFIFDEAFIDALLTASQDWKECYKNMLYGLQDMSHDKFFSLYDVTGDEIPELFVSDGYQRTSSCKIYSFKNGLIYIGKLGAYGGVSYSPSHELFYINDLAQGHEYFIYEKLNKDNILQKEISLYNNVGAAPSDDDIKYEINHEEVSYEEYQSSLDEYKAIKDFICLGDDLGLTKAVVDGVFNEASDWKEYYKNLLYGLHDLDDTYRFSLYDVTGDDIPELFISDGYSSLDICRIYSFKNGLINIMGRWLAYDEVQYSPGYNIFCCCNNAPSYSIFTYEKLNEDNIIQSEITFSNNIGGALKEDDIKYKIDYEEVSYEEYKNSLEEYSKIYDYVSLGREYCFTESDIIKAIYNFS